MIIAYTLSYFVFYIHNIVPLQSFAYVLHIHMNILLDLERSQKNCEVQAARPDARRFGGRLGVSLLCQVAA